MKKRKRRLTLELENPTNEAVLNLLKAGVMMATVFLFPGASKGIKNLFFTKKEYEPWQKYNKPRLKQAIKNLIKRKLLSIEDKNGEQIVTLTENGRQKILKYRLSKITIKKPEKWDRKWHVVIFDVGEEKHSLRDTLRRKMKTLGFFSLQKSVFVYPYPCEKEIAFLRQMYKIGNEVSVFTAINLEEDEFLCRYFKLT